MKAAEEKKTDISISISYKELKKAIKSIPLCDIDEIIDIDDIIDGFRASEILDYIDEDEIVDYAIYNGLLSGDDALDAIPFSRMIRYIKDEMDQDDFVDKTFDSVDDFIKILKNLVNRFNHTAVYTKEGLKKGVCELIDAYCI